MVTRAFRRILSPTDFSSCSLVAMDLAAGLAHTLGGELLACHVVREPVRPAAGGFEARRLLAALEELLKPAASTGVATRAAVVEGDAVAAIVSQARAWMADLVVLGCRGGRDRPGWGVGTVTDHVLRRAPCPVLAVPERSRRGAAPLGGTLFRRILCASDFSDAAAEALGAATSLVDPSSSRLLLLHVMEWFPEAESRSARIGVPEYGLDLSEETRDRLASALPPDLRACEREEIVAAGRPHRQILRLAREREVDLIVLGIHAERPVDRVVPGTTISHVLREAPCPVLAVRTHVREAERASAAVARR